MADILTSAGDVLWGAPMLMFFMGIAVYFTVKSKFFQFFKPGILFSSTLGTLSKRKHVSDGSVSEFGAFCSVLASSIGTGNIVGVATAIYSGGAGSVFWMWLSAVFSMMTAYAENYLGISYKYRNKYGKISGGAFSYIERGTGIKSLSKAYAVFCLFSTLGMGNLAQSNSISVSVFECFNINTHLIAAVTAALCFIIINGGLKRISKSSEIIVPLMTAAYLVLSFAVLYLFRENIIPSLLLILKEAFSLKAVNGYGMYKAMRFGISRGVFSNEAGLGSSTVIHSETDGKSPQNQGMWAMFEVFCDTVFLCTIMALVILVSGSFTEGTELFGASLTLKAYSVLGKVGTKGIALLTAVFAFASLTGSSYNGEKSLTHLFSDRCVKPYKLIYAVLAFIGAETAPKTVWAIADIFNGLMAVPNLFALTILRKRIEYPEKPYRE